MWDTIFKNDNSVWRHSSDKPSLVSECHMSTYTIYYQCYSHDILPNTGVILSTEGVTLDGWHQEGEF